MRLAPAYAAAQGEEQRASAALSLVAAPATPRAAHPPFVTTEGHERARHAGHPGIWEVGAATPLHSTINHEWLKKENTCWPIRHEW